MGLLIKSSGETLEVKPANGKNFSLKEAQSFVGGYVEMLNVNGKKYLMNEEGLLHRLPVNEKATEELSKEYGREVKPIVGDVLILSNEEFN